MRDTKTCAAQGGAVRPTRAAHQSLPMSRSCHRRSIPHPVRHGDDEIVAVFFRERRRAAVPRLTTPLPNSKGGWCVCALAGTERPAGTAHVRIRHEVCAHSDHRGSFSKLGRNFLLFDPLQSPIVVASATARSLSLAVRRREQLARVSPPVRISMAIRRCLDIPPSGATSDRDGPSLSVLPSERTRRL